MRLFNTATLDENLMKTLSDDEASWVYCGLDCCVTFEVYEKLQAEIDSDSTPGDNPSLLGNRSPVQYTYEMALAKQAPILEMALRGVRVDPVARDKSLAELRARLLFLETRFKALCEAAFGWPSVNWRSPVQVKTLFYTALGIKEIRKRNTKGEFSATVDEDALNKLCQHYWAQPFAKHLLALRETGKKIGFLETEIDSDGRMRTSYNIAGTNTGRLSSSRNDFDSGTNMQNIDTALRYPFVADDKMIFINVDLEQADARNVGAIIYNLFYDSHGEAEAAAYLDACESGDLHTTVCRMAWKQLAWPEDRKSWRLIADQLAYRDLSYRDMAKKLGHGTNYYGQPRTMAQHTHTPVLTIEAFQKAYFSAFPLIPLWHKHVIETIKEIGVLTTIYGRRRHFFGRGTDASTWRAAIAFAPQSMTGHQIDMGMLNLWQLMPEVQILAQVHDSILLQIPFARLNELLPRILEALRFEITLRGGRRFFVPLEAQVGWNWGKILVNKEGAVIGNPHGLTKWKGEEKRMPPLERLKDYI